MLLRKPKNAKEIHLAVAVCGMLLAVWGSAASAVTVSIDIAGQCYLECANVGLEDGDLVTGNVKIDGDYFAADDTSGDEALISYGFAFGNYAFDQSSGSSPGFSVGWGNTPGSIYSIVIESYASSDAINPGPLLSMYAFADFRGNGVASHDGYHRVLEFFTETNFGNAAYLTIDPVESTAPIPLPAAAWLLLSALFGAAGLHRLAGQAGAHRGISAP